MVRTIRFIVSKILIVTFGFRYFISLTISSVYSKSVNFGNGVG